jgi:hypothetical protein
MSMTKRQRSVVLDIEGKLGIPYEGNDGNTHASRFIAKHIESLREFNKTMGNVILATGKQMRYINHIEKELDVKYEGNTFNQAWEFISKYGALSKLRGRGILI